MDNGTNKLSTSQSSGGALNQPCRLHPLIATAAGTVIAQASVATAAMTGLFPKASSDSAQQPVVDSAAPSTTQSPSAQAAQQQAAQQQPAQPSYAQQQPQQHV